MTGRTIHSARVWRDAPDPTPLSSHAARRPRAGTTCAGAGGRRAP